MPPPTVPQPHVHMHRATTTTAGAGATGQVICPSAMGAANHAIFGGIVSIMPFEWVERRYWGWGRGDLLLEVLERQRQFIACLRPPATPLHKCGSPESPYSLTWSLRFLKRPGADYIEMALLGKAVAGDELGARRLALEHWEGLATFFPCDYHLEPLTCWDELGPFLGYELEHDVTEPDLTGRLVTAEIRRHETFVAKKYGESRVASDLVLAPFAWNTHALEHVWHVMARLPGPCLYAATVRPSRFTPHDEMLLTQLIRATRVRADSDESISRQHSKQAAQWYEECLVRYRDPFLMRVQVAAPPQQIEWLGRAAGSALTTLPLSDTKLDHLGPSYILEYPSAEETERAMANLALVDLEPWGEELAAPPYQRFRYLFDVVGVQCAFRLAFPPPGGFPQAQFRVKDLPEDWNASSGTTPSVPFR